jgi:hypothetical protein
MKLFIKDIVTDDLFSLECDPTDTIESIKHQILMHQSIPLSIHDLTVILYVPPNDSYLYDSRSSEYSEETDPDKPLQTGLLQEYGITDQNILMVIYEELSM